MRGKANGAWNGVVMMMMTTTTTTTTMMMMMMVSYFCRTGNICNRNVWFSFYLLSAGKRSVSWISKYGNSPYRKMKTNREWVQ
jgi:hypothetical protein